jgi:hypothetical protein
LAAEIVNLRMARKRKARAAEETKAAGNRALHGRSKADRQRERLETERGQRTLDGHRLAAKDDDASKP